jgi:hypothetical protein
MPRKGCFVESTNLLLALRKLAVFIEGGVLMAECKIEEVFFREADEVIASEGDPAVVEGVKTRINLLALYGAAREGRSSNHTLLGLGNFVAIDPDLSRRLLVLSTGTITSGCRGVFGTGTVKDFKFTVNNSQMEVSSMHMKFALFRAYKVGR